MPKLRPFQRQDVNFSRRHRLHLLNASSMGTGKAQPLDARVLTPMGWRAIGDLQVGDLVSDPDGGFGFVEGVFPQGKKQIYVMTTSDGARTRCCENHLWLVQTPKDRNQGKEGRVLSLAQMKEMGLRLRCGASRANRKWFLPAPSPVRFSPLFGPLDLDPYLVGALLGDGCLRDQPRFSSGDSEIVDFVGDALPTGLTLKKVGGSDCDYTIVGQKKISGGHPLRLALAEIGIWGLLSYEKHVPDAYLLAAQPKDRLALLRGLMDTDGTVTKGKASFSSTSRKLAEAVIFLTRSLGGKASWSTRTTTYTHRGERREGRQSYRVYVRMPVCPFRLTRKKAAWTPDFLAQGIDSIQFDGEEEAICIQVSTKRNLYITDDFLVTHNTVVAIRSVVEEYQWSFPCLVACPASVIHNWAKECRKWAPGIPVTIVGDSSSRLPKKRGFYISSWSLLDARWPSLTKIGMRTIIADEAHYAKNPDSLRSQAISHLVQSARATMLLSGTPIINTRAELQVLKDLLGTEDPPMIRRLLEDVAKDIPPKKRSSVFVRLRDRHQADYTRADQKFEDWLRKEKEKLLGEGMAEVEVERALAAEALAKIGYLRRLVGVCKVPAAVDWIARAVRIGEPVVVFLEHQGALRRLEKGLRKQRIRCGIIEGGTTPKQRQKIIDGFQRNHFPVFIGTKAAKEGITLTAARHLLFLERYFTSAEEEQAEDRIRRIGQKHKTTIWYLHALDTVDDRIASIVRAKRRIVRTAIGSADVAETDTGNVQSLIRLWGDHAVPDIQPEALGLGDPLPPLPSPRLTHAIVFYGQRWRLRSAVNWCRMNGYLPSRRVELTDRFKLVVHPPEVFQKGQFKSHRVSKDIKIITGNRLSRANEQRVRAAMRGAGR